jgi:hypothetical protein
VTLPGADELFRATSGAAGPARSADERREEEPGTAPADTAEPAVRVRPAAVATGEGPRKPTGRERHDEKITVYVSPEELIALEHARLNLRANHGLGVDRGRIVREAVAVVLADLDAKGADSILVRRLRKR